MENRTLSLKIDKKKLAESVLQLVYELDEWMRSAKKPNWANSDHLLAIMSSVRHVSTSHQIQAILEDQDDSAHVHDTHLVMLTSLHFLLEETFEFLKVCAEWARTQQKIYDEANGNKNNDRFDQKFEVESTTSTQTTEFIRKSSKMELSKEGKEENNNNNNKQQDNLGSSVPVFKMPMKMFLHMENTCNDLVECWNKHLSLYALHSNIESRNKTVISEQDVREQCVQISLQTKTIKYVFSRTLVPPTIINSHGQLSDVPVYSSLLSFNGIPASSWTIIDFERALEDSGTDEVNLIFRLPVAPVHLEDIPSREDSPERLEESNNNNNNNEEDDDGYSESTHNQEEKKTELNEKEVKVKSEVDKMVEHVMSELASSDEEEEEEEKEIKQIKQEVKQQQQQQEEEEDDDDFESEEDEKEKQQQQEEEGEEKQEQQQGIEGEGEGEGGENDEDRTGNNDENTNQENFVVPVKKTPKGTLILPTSAISNPEPTPRTKKQISKLLTPRLRPALQPLQRGYRFLITIENLRGLPKKCTEIIIEVAGNDEQHRVPVNDGVAEWNYILKVDRFYIKHDDKRTDAKIRIKWKEHKIGKFHLNLERLRCDVDEKNGPALKSAHISGVGGAFISMDFTFDYGVIEGGRLFPRFHATESTNPDDLLQETKAIEGSQPLLQVRVKAGPLGASFSGNLVPPTIIKFIPLPDGSKGPLERVLQVGSQLIGFNDIDTSRWTVEQFRRYVYLTGDLDQDRVLTFRLPLPSLEYGVPSTSQTNEEDNENENAYLQGTPSIISTTRSNNSSNEVEEEDDFGEFHSRCISIVGELVENLFARDFWYYNFGTRFSVEWHEFKSAFLENEDRSELPLAMWSEDNCDTLSTHLDIWCKGEVHICAFNRFTKKFGVFGSIGQILHNHRTYTPPTQPVFYLPGPEAQNPPQKSGGGALVDPILQRTVLIVGVDVLSIISFPKTADSTPEYYTNLNLWIEEIGEISRVVSSVDGVGVVVEFQGFPKLVNLISQTRPQFSTSVVLKGRPYIDAIYPSPYSIDTVLYLRTAVNPYRLKSAIKELELLELAWNMEGLLVEEDELQNEMNVLQQWLQNLIMPSNVRVTQGVKKQEKGIIRVYKQHITKLTEQFALKQAQKDAQQQKIKQNLRDQHYEIENQQLNLFFAKIRTFCATKKTGEGICYNSKRKWINSLNVSIQEFMAESNDRQKWIESFTNLCMGVNQRAFSSLLKRVDKQKTEAARETILDMELPGNYKCTRAEADKLLKMLTTNRMKCDTLVALHSVLINREDWDGLVNQHIPSASDQDSIKSLVAPKK